jgi:glycosyltransferase involved in cell wall biosynthesis
VSAPRLTVAIPFHRGLAYLREAIESVRAQTTGDWRLLVCDDRGEPDPGAAEALVASFGDARIAYARNDTNLGMVTNWNRCLDRAETELVTLLHADDRLLPGYAASMLELAERSPEAAACFCEAEIIGASGRRRFSFADAMKAFFRPPGEPLVLRGEPALRALAGADFIVCPTLCFRRARLGPRRFDARWRQVQDLELLARLLLEGETLVGTRSAGYAYRRHPESATERQSESLLRFEEELALLAELSRAAEERGWHGAARTAARAWTPRLHLAWRALRDAARGRLGAAAAKLRFLARGTRPEEPPSRGRRFPYPPAPWPTSKRSGSRW